MRKVEFGIAVSEMAMRQGQVDAAGAANGRERLEVMVVDDERGMVEGVRRVLEAAEFALPELGVEVRLRVTTAESGEEALEKLALERPDILLLDHKLGGISGLEVLERLGEETRGMLVIMITAYASLDTAVTAIKRGAHDFLAKPFTPAELRVTLRKAVETLMAARQARRLAEERRQVRFQFISVLAHELKAPIAAVQGYLGLMGQRALGEELGGYDEMVGRCVKRLEGMQKLILDLLDLTRIESGQRKREVSAVDVREVLGHVMETLSPLAGERGITVAASGVESAVVQGDRSELEIMFNNLVSNAIKYNRDGGRVEVTVGEHEEMVEVAVKDTGIGMTPAEAGQLFQDFKRIKNAQTVHIPGSGLGLSIVKKLAYLYEGDVKVVSEAGVGSTFTVRLARGGRDEEVKS